MFVVFSTLKQRNNKAKISIENMSESSTVYFMSTDVWQKYDVPGLKMFAYDPDRARWEGNV